MACADIRITKANHMRGVLFSDTTQLIGKIILIRNNRTLRVRQRMVNLCFGLADAFTATKLTQMRCTDV